MNETDESLDGQEASKQATDADFYASMEKAGVTPLWDRYNDLIPPEPTPRDPGTQWRWQDLLPLIERASSDITTEHAERRVLMLLNPIFNGEALTTTGMFGALQILLPGEMARVHRHSATAFRFVMDGRGAQTTVNGKVCPMNEGDVVLTPNWAWHEHANPGSERVCWFDGLDYPLAAFYNAVFSDHGPAGNFPPDQSTLPDGTYATAGLVADTKRDQVPFSPMFHYPWSGVCEALAAMEPEADGSRRVHYTNPVDGGPVTPTMDLYALQLSAKAETKPYRTTSNAICVVAEGEGATNIGDKRIDWQKNDIFTLPHWTWISHVAASDNAKLFLSTDRAVLKQINLLRDEVKE